MNLKKRKKERYCTHYKDTHAVRSILARFQLLRRGIFFSGADTHARTARFLGKTRNSERALKISITIVIDAPVAPAAPLSILACIDRCHRNFRIACHITCHLSFPANHIGLDIFSSKSYFLFAGRPARESPSGCSRARMLIFPRM